MPYNYGGFRGGYSSIATADPNADLKALVQAYWKLDEFSDGSGPVTRVDSGPNGLHLTDVNTVASGVGHVYANAAAPISANSEYLQRTVPASGGDIDFSVMAWAFPTSSSGAQAVFSCFNGGHNGFGTVYWNEQVSKFSFQVSPATIADPTVRSTGAWYLVITTFVAATNTGTIYVNDGSGTSVVAGPPATSTNLTLFRPGTVAAQFFDGRTGPAAIFSGILDSGQRSRLWNGGAGLALY